MQLGFTTVIAFLLAATSLCVAEELVLRGEVARVSVSVAGGGITELGFVDSELNPLSWMSEDETTSAIPRGHFLCLDRWGAPSAAEAKNGMPFHGEAPHTRWEVAVAPRRDGERVTATMRCDLPLADLRVERTLELDANAAVLHVTETVSNTGARGRIYNMVQHPTIAPPFLDDTTLVDTNATAGFWQQDAPPASDEDAVRWPRVTIDGRDVDLRRLRTPDAPVTRHDVCSFVFGSGDSLGWVTACTPQKQLLIGYLWSLEEYPWLNIWRSVRSGQIVARGLEFGTTGYHQPFGQLVEQGTILDHRLYSFLDAGASHRREYTCFLVRVDRAFRGVAAVEQSPRTITLIERETERRIDVVRRPE